MSMYGIGGYPGGTYGAGGNIAGAFGGTGCPGTKSFLEHINRYIGQTVTIFTTSGGVSGCGFTGVLYISNPCYVTLRTQQGTPPSCPLGSSCCKQFKDGKEIPVFTVGSVCEIPIDKIASFCHTAV